MNTLTYNLSYTRVDHWAPLAWAAQFRNDSNVVDIAHGTGVETRSEWFCEAVWDGPFEEGNFDKTDIFFGSGIRLRGNSAIIVPSGSTVDRLQYVENDNGFIISNSLPCLLAYARMPSHLGKIGQFGAIKKIKEGIEIDDPALRASGAKVFLTYFKNISVEGETRSRITKPGAERTFELYQDYVDFVQSSLGQVAVNGIDPARHTKFKLMGTMSSGYDSSSSSAFGLKAGLTEAVTVEQGRHGVDDSGSRIGEAIGLKMHKISRSAWKRGKHDDIPIIASGAAADVPLLAAQDLIKNTILLTGFNGSGVWNRQMKSQTTTMERGDTTGQGLTEWRLWASFIHLPVPYIGGRSVPSINKISVSEEMKPWAIKGVFYCRPICRRILEDLGVEREWFGMKNSAVAIGRFEKSMKPTTRRQLFRWMRDNKTYWTDRGKVPPIYLLPLREFAVKFFLFDPKPVVKALLVMSRVLPEEKRSSRVALENRIGRFQQRIKPVKPVMAFALDILANRYRLDDK